MPEASAISSTTLSSRLSERSCVCGLTARPPSIKATFSPPADSSTILKRLPMPTVKIVPAVTQRNSTGFQSVARTWGVECSAATPESSRSA